MVSINTGPVDGHFLNGLNKFIDNGNAIIFHFTGIEDRPRSSVDRAVASGAMCGRSIRPGGNLYSSKVRLMTALSNGHNRISSRAA
jgi:hypothetical protein